MLLGGVHFQNISLRKGKTQPQLIYRIFLPQKTDNVHWNLEKFWLENDPESAQSDHNQIPSSPPYWQSAFLSIQYAIESIFVKMVLKYFNNINKYTIFCRIMVRFLWIMLIYLFYVFLSIKLEVVV